MMTEEEAIALYHKYNSNRCFPSCECGPEWDVFYTIDYYECRPPSERWRWDSLSGRARSSPTFAEAYADAAAANAEEWACGAMREATKDVFGVAYTAACAAAADESSAPKEVAYEAAFHAAKAAFEKAYEDGYADALEAVLEKVANAAVVKAESVKAVESGR